MTKLTRRSLLGTMGVAAAATALPRLPAMAADRTVRHFWWGNPERDKRTFAVIDVFQKNHPDIEVSGETIGWGDYWTKMATQTAGRNMADLVQMDYRFLFEYVRRGALQPLDEHIGNGLDLSNFDKGPLSGGMVDGKLYALNIGSNSQVIPYNTRIFEEAGVDADVINWTWDDFKNVCEKITSHSGGSVKGSDDFSLYIEGCESWARQNGRNFYDEEGNVQATPEDVAGYWQFWDDMRKAEIVRGKDKTLVLDHPMSETGVVTGESAMALFWSNQLVGVQSLMKDTVGAAMIPHKAGGSPGQFIKPSMFMSLTRDARDVDGAIAYMNDWINEPETTSILGLERGIPANPNVRAALEPNFTPPELASVNYFNAIQDKVGPLPLPAPKGAGEVRDAYMRIGTDVVLGNMSSDEAAGIFIEDAQAIVDRAR
ncbi:extracellular solute-binding protein [uncultured Roseibium sp.]|uniref:ABC transporter substrate-binding protein n=1 Tax=uncultured Roseibium sp. TaxID=1936171 RepID=UPI0026167E44|nr:extracellular solute-binding protein [uncultured Roseibium sp.]